MDPRDEFLRTWYTVLWSNIDRSMTSMWQIVGPMVLVGAAFIYSDKLGPHLTAVLQFVVIFWALNNTIDMNSWHRRNLIFVTRVENQFLTDADYGQVIPTSFREPKTRWINFYTINFVTFLGLLLITVLIYIARLARGFSSAPCLVIGPAAVLFTGVAATIHTYRRCEDQIGKYFHETKATAKP